MTAKSSRAVGGAEVASFFGRAMNGYFYCSGVRM
jgi:hypothetical protein